MIKLLSLCVLALAVVSPALCEVKGLPKAIAPEGLGVNIHFTSGQEKQVEQIAQAGFKFIRMDFIWDRIESKKGEYDFSEYDGLIADLDKHGIRPIFILDYANPHYDNNLPPHTDEGRLAFANFAKAGVSRYKGRGVVWELWNEPNLDKFWWPKSNPEDYVKLAKVVYPMVKDADPECTLIGPALGCWDMAFLDSIMSLGALEYLDAVSVHPYGASKPEDAVNFYAAIRKLIEKYGPRDRKMPIISGEWGYSTFDNGVSEEMQGHYLPRMFLTNLANDIPLSIWYDWHDDGDDPNEVEHRFGVVDRQFKPKPSYKSMQTLSSELTGYSFAARMDLGGVDDHLLLFAQGDHIKLAAWTTGEPRSIEIKLDVAEVEITSTNSGKSRIPIEENKLKLELTREVKYVSPIGNSVRLANEAKFKASAVARVKDGKVVVEVQGSMDEQNRMKLSVIPGRPAEMTIGDDPKAFAKMKTQWEGRLGYGPDHGTMDPRRKARITITFMDAENNAEIARTVDVDTSALPYVDVLAPSGMDLLVMVGWENRETNEPFKGKIKIANSDGIRLEEDVKDFTLDSDRRKAMLRFPMSHDPAAMFSFAVTLQDEQGSPVLRLPSRRYYMSESFADGKPGDDVTKYQVTLDGDPKVRGEAKLTYVDAPKGSPLSTCARLDYDFASGWKFVGLNCRPTVGIYEQPTAARIWVKADNKNASLRLRVLDSDGQTFQSNYGELTFSDWQCLTAPLVGNISHWGGRNDGVMRYPIAWDAPVLFDSNGKEMKGSIYLGPIMLIYD